MIEGKGGNKMIKNGQSIETRIGEHRFFQSLRPDHLKIVAEGAQLKTFGTREILFLETDPANRLFLIESWKFVLEARNPHGEEMAIETLGDGDVVGWSCLIPPFAWRFQARAIEPTNVIVINGAHLLATSEENPALGYTLMQRVAQLMAHRLEILRRRVFEEYEQNAPAQFASEEDLRLAAR
jgi:CRP/FNR family cyclic AMP-dependent transcriptional regulator